MPPKTPETRQQEARLIREKLGEMGFVDEALGDVDRALDDFAARGWGSTATHTFPELGVAVVLLLSVQAHVTSYARVRALEGRR